MKYKGHILTSRMQTDDYMGSVELRAKIIRIFWVIPS